MIYLSELVKSFHPKTPLEVKAIRGITLELPEESFTIVIGSNGSGKSTLLNLLAGTVLPDSGTIRLEKKYIERLPEYARSRYIARVFQNPVAGTAPDMSLIDNFRLAALRTGSKKLRMGITTEFRKEVKSFLVSLDMNLEERLDQPMSSFSGGQRQAISLLMATYDKLDLLLLDEPTAALDPKSAEVVMKLANQIIRERKLTALLVTHDLRHCNQYGDRIIQLENGSIKRDISHSGIRPDLSTVYKWFE
jgi:putative ABC transport system ATP-binding protein